MLLSLRIGNYVLIEDSRIEFDAGLNALTGETGAGKSIILDALSLLTGERSSSERVRQSDRDAVVEAEFEISETSHTFPILQKTLSEWGIDFDENVVLIKRVLSPEGRSRIWLNHTQCLVKQLKEIGSILLDIHGQHDHQSLLHPSSYAPLVDRYGKSTPVLSSYQTCYQTWTDAKKRLEALETAERERLRREDTLRFQIEELKNANIQAGEDEAIDSKLSVLKHAEKINQSIAAIVNKMQGSGEHSTSIQDELDEMESRLQTIAGYDTSLNPMLENWRTATIALQEAVREIENYSEGLEFDPDSLEEMQQRRFLLRDLKNKYGATLEEVLQYQAQIEQELQELQDSEEKKESLQKEESELRRQLAEQAVKLHQERTKKAERLSKTITSELHSLGMAQVEFRIDVSWLISEDGIDIEPDIKVKPGSAGADKVEFLISTIPGKPPRPLKEVASGGEISRIMLALKCTFGKADPVPTMIFDEIDVGVGGQTAEIVADRLAQLAKTKQVICITHLPHIASAANRNLHVDKQNIDGQLSSSIHALSAKEREKEIARMLGGEDSTASKRYARELLKSAKK